MDLTTNHASHTPGRSHTAPPAAKGAAAPRLDLPTDLRRPARNAGRRARAARRLSTAAAAATPAEALAAFATLLHRYTGARRFELAVEPGDSPPVLLTVDVAGAADFGGLAAALGGELPTGPAAAAEDLPAAPGGAGFAVGGASGPATERDLTLIWRPDGDGSAALLYDPELYTADGAARHLARFETLLTAALQEPRRPLEDLPYLPPAERRTVLVEHNPAPARRSGPPRMEARVAAQAAATPGAVAVVAAGGVSWSYRRLDAAAAAVADLLHRRGVGPGDRVAVCLPRGPQLVATLLGVHRAGACYVPLDPDYPARRLAFMLADSGAAALVSTAALDEALPAQRPPLVDLAAVDLDVATSAAPPPRELPAEALSHLIYTSGSTGTPKGVAIRHAAAARMLDWAQGTFTPAERAGVLAATSVCFDLSVFEIFLPLSTGGAVVLADDALALPGLDTEVPVTLVNTVPSVMEELLRAGGLPPTVRTVNLAGEPLSRDLVERLYALPGVEAVYDLYGPSEDTTYSTWERVPRGAGLAVTIGRPVDGTRAYVVDPRLRPVGIGIPGELCLAGDGLARGYFGRPARSAEVFVPDPFGEEPGGRLYRTGDLARRLPDGRLDFLGRIDHQVKLRGFRIELGEIEAALRHHPDVAEAVAMVQRADGGDPRLTAYWTSDGGDAVGAAALRDHLATRLPAYMLPSHWVPLPEMPLTPNGKVDRRALPAPGAGRPDLETDYRPPAAGTEAEVAALLRELLSLDRVGADDDLFELGGHSLLATRLLARIRRRMEVELPPETPFVHRTAAALAARIEELRDGGGTTEATALPEPPPPRRYPRDRPIPLAYQQQQIWVINQLKPDNLAYNFQYTVRFRGPFERGVLERALSEIVRRHEVLRTVFPTVDGTPVQEVREPWAARVPLVDLGALPESPRRREEARLVAGIVRRRFDVRTLPLLEWTLLRLGPQEHLFFQVEQHFVHDGWSIGRILFEIQDLYAAFAAGEPSPLPELPVQCADYALWQRDYMQGEALEVLLAYWRRVLADLPPPLDLPSDRPRRRAQSFRGRRLDVDVPPELYADLLAFGRRRGYTLFMLMTAAFEVLLARYGERTDFILGSAAANRRFEEFEPLIGMLVNTLVLRADLSAWPSFEEVVRRVRTVALGMQAHQDLPFEALVAELQPERDLSRNPIFQHMFSFHDAPVPDLRFAGLEGELVERHNGSAKTDLNVIVKPRGSQRVGRAPAQEDRLLRVLWEYSTDLFDDTTAARMWGHYLNLLRALVERPEVRVDRVELLSPAERRAVLEEPGDTGTPRGGPPRLEARVAAQAPATPGAVAVTAAGGVSWSYRRLDAAAAAVADLLRRRGVGPGDRVAVCLPRTPQLVATLLGVHRAGACYVPLDPDYPARRLAFMLADSGAAALVSTAALDEALPAQRPPLVDLAAVDLGVATSAVPPPRELPAEALSHLIYTSGSTGTPKGVAIRHAAAARMLDWAQGTFTPAERAGVLAATSVCFDLSVFEIFLPLSTGGAVVLADDALALPGLDTEVPVTLVNTVPSVMEELLRAGGLPPTVRTVNLAGEPLSRDLVERLYALPGVEAVYDLYGPSEDTTYSTWERVPRGAGLAVTIGRPVDGTRAYVVDPRLRPVGIGIPGELCLAGDGLARGYFGRPASTAEVFVPDPFGEEPGGRLYRTGDLARRLPDGRLDFLGRIDHQVKLRGFRIELGEIEAALRHHPDVAEAAVVVDRQATRLVAFHVTPDGAGTDSDRNRAAALRDHLAARLPAYMLPAAFVPLAELPLTPNGKVDRRRLVAEARGAAATGGGGEPPRTPTEKRVAEVWAGVLAGAGGDGPAIGAHDDFFALGGHSLLGAKAAARTGHALGVEVTLPDLFEHPTVAAFAALVERRRRSGAAPAGIPRRAREGEALPLSFAQERLWLIDRLVPLPSTYHLGRAFRLRGALSPGALAGAVADLVRRHTVLRTVFEEGPEGLRQRVRPLSLVAVRPPLIDLSALPPASRGAEQRRLLVRGAEQPLDLTADAPLRTWTLRRGETDHTLLLVLHHAAVDGWSLPILYRDLAALYRARRDGVPADLPELPVTYADYARWQRRRLRGERLHELLAFWRSYLEGAPEALELPTDHPRPALRSMRGGRVEHHLGTELATALRRLGRDDGSTLFMVLLAAWAALLARLGGQRDVVIGVPTAARQAAEVEELAGFFVNALPLRVRLEAGAGFAALLAHVREQTLAALAHQELPFERLVDELAPQRDLAHSPLYQVTLAYQETGEPDLALAGLDVEAVEVPRQGAHFELSLFAGGEPGGGLALKLTYERDLFDADTVARLAARLERLLAAAAADPERAVEGLPLLGEEERRQVLFGWAGGEAPPAVPVPTALEAAFTVHPERTAVAAGGEGLTYRELERRSRVLARRLIAAGAEAETVVGVCLPPGPDMVVAVCAVLRAGGAYLPLDPSHPADRLAYTLGDAAAPLLIADPGRAPADFEGRTLAVDGAGDGGDAGAPLPPPAVLGDQLAYVIYTSGTTGRPKGTALTHGGLAGLVAWHRRAYDLGAGDRSTLVASPAFDAAVWEVWPCLSAGASLHVPQPEVRADPPRLYRWLAAEGITVSFLPTPLAEAMLSGEPPDGLALRALLVGGDRLHRAPGNALPYRLVNHYGPTEDTVVTTAGDVAGDVDRDDGDGVPPSIGRPLPGRRVQLLDGARQPVPAGVPGELWIGGPGLARGYPGRPGLTADRFRPDPFAGETGAGAPGDRLYRTGDLARWRRDGRLDFIGRRDGQVKLRGFRIELREIETRLAAAPTVSTAAVVLDRAATDPRLVAFVVPRDGSGTTDDGALTAELADRLSRRLPAYMVPAAWSLVDELPTSATGKVDRRALERCAAEVAVTGAGGRPPETATERELADIWSRELSVGAGDLGADDDFFALGGNSLAATRVLSAIRDAFGVELPLARFFAAPTVAGLASLVTAAGDGTDGDRPADSIGRLDRSAHRRRRPAPAADGKPDADRREESGGR